MTILPVDFNALAALRPGDGKDALARALGSRWREPAPHQQGFVQSIERLHGFRAQIDTSGHIGAIFFHEPFPNVEIAGLHIGMSPKDVLAKQPELKEMSRLPLYETVYYAAEISSRCLMMVQFRWGQVYQIALRNQQAVFPPEQPIVYPAAESTLGAPFADSNFKLVVLSSLLESNELDLSSYEELARFVLKRPVDLEKEGYELLPAAYDYLARYPLTEADLALVESIVFDGGNDIYPYCYRFWDGETADFDVTSVAGIERCVNLRNINCIALIDSLDIAALVGLTKLEEISLPETCDNPQCLLDLPALKKLSFHDGVLIDPILLAGLRANGVSIHVFK